MNIKETSKEKILADDNTPWEEIVPLLKDLKIEKGKDGRFHGKILTDHPSKGLELSVPVYDTDGSVLYRVRAQVQPPVLGRKSNIGDYVGVRGRIETFRKENRVVAIRVRGYGVITRDPR